MNKDISGSQKIANMENRNNELETGNPRICWNEVKIENVAASTVNTAGVESVPSPAKRLIKLIFPYINTIDLWAFCVYLCLFVLFNCIYWPKYL